MACCSMTRKRREDRSLTWAFDDEAFMARADKSGFARTKPSIFVISNHASRSSECYLLALARGIEIWIDSSCQENMRSEG